MFGNKTLSLVTFLFVLAYYKCAGDNRPEVIFRVDVYRNTYRAIFKCIDETGIHPEVIQSIRDGTYEEDAKFKKFLYCSYVKSGYATEDGTVKIDDMAKEFPAEYNIITVLKNCLDTVSDPEERVFNFLKCFQKTSPVRMAF